MVSQIRIQDLDCPDCAAKLERDVRRAPGVETAEMNFFLAKMTVVHRLNEEELLQTVADAGYAAVVMKENGELQNERPTQAGFFAAIAAVLALLGLIYFPFLALAMLVGGWKIAGRAWRSLQRRRLDINVLMSTAIVGAVIIGEWREGAMVAVLFAISHWLEQRSLDNARKSIRALLATAPSEAVVLTDSGREVLVPVHELKIGQEVIVRSGQKIPVDGVVRGGHSFVDEKTITGEGVPRPKEPGAEVYAGTINQNGLLQVVMTKPAGQSVLAQIAELVAAAQEKKTPRQLFIEKFAAYYTPSMLLFALLLGAAGFLRGLPLDDSIYRSLSLLVIACPCALVLASPISLAAGMGNAAKHGIMIKSGAHLEQAGRIRRVLFDKTGTLTYGRPQVTKIWKSSDVPESLLPYLTWHLEQGSTHTAAKALQTYWQEPGSGYGPVSEVTAIPGRGVGAKYENTPVYLVNPRHARDIGCVLPAEAETWEQQGITLAVLIIGQKPAAVYGLEDSLRESAPGAVGRLEHLGFTTAILSGDSQQAAASAGSSLGIAEVHAQLLPADKQKLVHRLSEEGNTAMVGEGLNDSPALAEADLGIAMGGIGSDLAKESAHVVLVNDNLQSLEHLFGLGRKTLRVVKQNISLALVLKAAALGLAVAGLLTLWMAVLADMGASLLVAVNGTRLWSYKSAYSRRRVG